MPYFHFSPLAEFNRINYVFSLRTVWAQYKHLYNQLRIRTYSAHYKYV